MSLRGQGGGCFSSICLYLGPSVGASGVVGGVLAFTTIAMATPVEGSPIVGCCLTSEGLAPTRLLASGITASSTSGTTPRASTPSTVVVGAASIAIGPEATPIVATPGALSPVGVVVPGLGPGECAITGPVPRSATVVAVAWRGALLCGASS